MPPERGGAILRRDYFHLSSRSSLRKKAEVRHVEALKLESGIGQEFRRKHSLAVVGYLLRVNCRVSRSAMAGRLLDTFSEKQEKRPRRFNLRVGSLNDCSKRVKILKNKCETPLAKSCSSCLLDRYPSVCLSRKPVRLISFEGFATPSLIHAIISERLRKLNRRGIAAPPSNETMSGHRN